MFDLHAEVAFGVGAAITVSDRLAAWNLRRIGFVIDEAILDADLVQAVIGECRRGGLHVVKVYPSRARQEPDYDYLDSAAEEFRLVEIDALVGIGGGSAMDLAKGVAILLRNEGCALDYRGVDKVGRPGVAAILVPTTAGTGSETTNTASFIDKRSLTKLGINGRYVGCRFSALDPTFVVSCPRAVTVSAGLDALVHGLEAVTCRTANPVSVVLGIEAVRLMLSGLPQAVACPDDIDARSTTLLGSHFAGLAMRNAGGGPASGISYPLGVHFQVPHGLAGGVFLPHVVTFNIAAGYVEGYARIYERLDRRSRVPASDVDKAVAFRDDLSAVYERIGAPKTFRTYGVTVDDIARLTRLTVEQRRGNLDVNPVPFTEADVSWLLERVVD